MSIDKNLFFNVKNRSAGMVLYKIPEMNIRREFAPGEVKRASYDELEKLSFQSGGRALMNRYLQITNAEVINELNLTAEPEYYMSEQQIMDLLKSGSLDAFLDCLDFAPEGVIDLIKQYAVSLPLNDIEKRNAIKEKTGFDVDKAVANNIQDKAVETAEKPARRVQSAAETGRRTSTDYKIVSIEN